MRAHCHDQSDRASRILQRQPIVGPINCVVDSLTTARCSTTCLSNDGECVVDVLCYVMLIEVA